MQPDAGSPENLQNFILIQDHKFLKVPQIRVRI